MNQPSSPNPAPDPSDPHPDLLLSSYDYELPAEQIAQNPVVPRDSSRLLVVTSATEHRHCIFRDLPTLLCPGDLLILNNTRVIPARLHGQTTTGARVEVLLLEERHPNHWLALVKPGRRLKLNTEIVFGAIPQPGGDGSSGELRAVVIDRDEATGGRVLAFDLPDTLPLLRVLEHLGEVPLPPYVTASQAQADQYQTVYAEHPGSAAAPTAGLHFTPDLLQRLDERGIHHAFITLHVGVGTFRPVEAETITQHQMHGEWMDVSAEVVAAVERTKATGGRVIAVGTTAVRSLEGAALTGQLQPTCAKTHLFIYPGYQWRVVDGLITNFHLPKSSLMMLVSALIGRPRLLALYQDAIAQQYRFYSFGDAMLILPEAQGGGWGTDR